MAAINQLISRIQDPELRASIEAEVNKLSKQKKFGLVFEDHIPECTPLYELPIRVGSLVAKKSGSIDDLMKVTAINGDTATCLRQNEEESVDLPVGELVAVARFGEPIYPYLKPIDTVRNAPDSDLWHTLIQADNYHALQLLEYLYAGKVDCIYIDPPYNTGAKDWKYNNDYVDGSDAYRHSKWLSFMEKRLKLAKRLLNSKTGVIIVTIDEHEVHHLRVLLEEVFSGFYIQMTTDVINPKGVTQGRFSRVEEYNIFCFAPNAFVDESNDNLLNPPEEKTRVRWKGLLRSGTDALREDRENMFYPVLIDDSIKRVIAAGNPLPLEEQPDIEARIDGYAVAWPIREDGSWGRWGVGSETLNALIEKGYVACGSYDKKRKTWGLSYISQPNQEAIEEGRIVITGRDSITGVVSVEHASTENRVIKTVWHRTSHDAGAYGSDILSAIIGKSDAFSFPKSVYSELDSIGSILRNKKNALVIDFFAGSGTTLHAINLLNAGDGGKRRCILVTNNEVSAKEALAMKGRGILPGDKEWEDHGIAKAVTWPRTVCSINGVDLQGNPLKGNYGVEIEAYESDEDIISTSAITGKQIKGKVYRKVKKQQYEGLAQIQKSDGFKANVAFFELGFLDKASVRVGRQFREMLPTLWMKAGCYGPCPKLEDDAVPDMMILPQNHMAILNDNSAYANFAEKVNQEPLIDTVYLVTDSDADYRFMSRGLSAKNKVQLYRDYLDNFRINSRR